MIDAMRRFGYSPLRALFEVVPGLRRAGGETVSVYLPVRAEGYDDRYYDIVFGDLRHRYRERLGASELVVLDRELPLIRTRLAVLRPAGCSALAAFAESESNLLETVRLPLPVAERLEVGDPLLAPALRQLEASPPALILVVDKERARTFEMILDELLPLGEISGAAVKHSKAGGSSALSNQRKADNIARSNLEAALRLVSRQFDRGAFAQLYVAGPQEARAEVGRRMSPELHRMLAGHLGASLDSATLTADLRRELAARRPAA